MTDPIEEVRRRRAEQRARQLRGEGMGDGWTEGHIDTLLAEIDRLREQVHHYEVQYQDEQGLDGAREERGAALAESDRLRASLLDSQNDAVRLRLEVARLREQVVKEVAIVAEERDVARDEIARLHAVPASIIGQEVEIRAYVECYDRATESIDLIYLRRALKLLDEARALSPPGKVAELGVTINELRAEITRLRSALAMPTGGALFDALDGVRSTQPPEPWSPTEREMAQICRQADAMERVGGPQEIAEDWTPKPADRVALAMEIAEYGDQRAREATEQERSRCALIDGVDLDAVRREARREVIAHTTGLREQRPARRRWRRRRRSLSNILTLSW